MELSQETLEEATDEDLNFVMCPGCGRNDMSSSQGIATHFAQKHEGSLKYVFRCEYCDEIAFGSASGNRFCSKDCETLHRCGTLKHQNEDYLTEKIVGEDARAVEVADELGVNESLIHKWVRKYEVGDEYECPSCDASFGTKQGVSKHHSDEHGESISGMEYECETCGEINWTPRCDEDDWRFPKYCGMDCRDTGRKVKEVEETGHIVDSGWEEEIDLLLYNDGVEYMYNTDDGFPTFKVNGKYYTPDFVVGNCIIEVKSSYYYDLQEEEIYEKAAWMTDNDGWRYVVVGDKKFPCDVFVEWENREDLLNEV